MSEFKIPSRFEDLVEDSTQRFSVCIDDVLNMEDLSNSELIDRIEDLNLIFDNHDGDGYSEYNQSQIDIMYSVINGLSYLSNNSISAFVEALTSIVAQSIDILSNGPETTIQNQSKACIFFLQVFCQKYEHIWKTTKSPELTNESDTSKTNKQTKKKSVSSSTSSNNLNWASHRIRCLDIFRQVLTIDPNNLWDMGIIPENFLFGFWKYSLEILEDRSFDNNSMTSQLCIKIIIACSEKFNTSSTSTASLTPLSSTIVNIICQTENILPLSRDIAEICKHSNQILIAEILNDFGSMNMLEKSKVKNAIKNIQIFLNKLTEISPELMCNYISLIIDQVDCEVYGIRNSILEVMGILAIHIFNRNKKYTTRVAEGGSQYTDESYDIDEESRNIPRLMKLYDSIYEHLIIRIHDVSSYTRSATLKIWSDLIENEAILTDKFNIIAKLAYDRISDKAVYVRKAAVSLLTVMLDHNPYGSNLDIEVFAYQKAIVEKAIATRLELLNSERNLPDTNSRNRNKESVKTDNDSNQIEDQDEVEEEDEEDDISASEFQESVSQDMEIKKLQATHVVAVNALTFIETVAASEEKIKLFIHSKTNTDVVEALKFFMRAVNFGVNSSMKFLCSTFSLIWHQEDSIKKQCVETFKHVFLTDGAANNPLTQPCAVIVKDLIKLCQECDSLSFTSLEQIIVVLMNGVDTILDDHFIDTLWSQIQALVVQNIPEVDNDMDNNNNNTTPTVSISVVAAAMSLASIVAHAKPQIITDKHVKLIIVAGMCDRVFLSNDFNLIKATARCLQAVPIYQDTTHKLHHLYVAVQHAVPGLQAVISGRWCEDNVKRTRCWFSVCEECVHALYHIHPTPEKIMAMVAGQQFTALGTIPSSENDNDPETSTGGMGEGGVPIGYVNVNVNKMFASVTALSRLVFTVGQSALCTVVLVEKTAKESKKVVDKLPTDNGENGNGNAVDEDDVLLTANKRDETSGNVDPEANAMEEEMGLVAAADAEHDKILEFTTEHDLVCNENYLFAKFHPIIAYIVANEKKSFSNPLLRETALLSLCRLMSVSSILTDKYLPLLFTVLEKYSLSASERSTVLIAVGDLAFRFPNSMEPLTEKNSFVRYNTLMVLTHLILNDMVKVKGQVSQVVLCLVDTSEAIRGLAALFFTELSKRTNNPVYNLLGDIIGSLSGQSDTSTATSNSNDVMSTAAAPVRILSKVEFQLAMTFLLKFVTKDKQADSLLERLLIRMETANGMKQLRNLAFCVSQLPITEKGVRRMCDLIKHYKDALHDKEVRTFIVSAALKTKKGMKNMDSAKVVVEEFELLVATTVGELDRDENGVSMSMDDTGLDNDENNNTYGNTTNISNASILETNNSARQKTNKSLSARNKKSCVNTSTSTSQGRQTNRSRRALQEVNYSDEERKGAFFVAPYGQILSE
eukprot:gene8396-17310_t